MRISRLLIFCACLLGAQSTPLEAARFVFGANAGVEFPFAHDSSSDLGARAEAFFRVDPYEIRFSYAELETDFYSLVVTRKLFFSEGLLRPYFEAGGGMVIVQTDGEGTAYGVTPVISLGADLGVTSYLSLQVAARYEAYWYFGDTSSGGSEANHSLSLVGGASLWF